MTIDAEAFRRAASSFASGVTVITAAADGRKWGMTASAVCSLSLNPTMMLACVDKRAVTLELIRESRQFNINVLSEEQRDLAGAFASKDLPRDSLLDESATCESENGVPVLAGCTAVFVCRLTEELEGGDHVILLGEVIAANTSQAQNPLVYFRGSYGAFTTDRALQSQAV